jgi:hypothetical protein
LEYLSDRTSRYERTGNIFMVQCPNLFECVRERIMTEVVKQGSGCDDSGVIVEMIDVTPLAEHRNRAAREVVRAQRMLEPRVRGAGINQVRQTKLAHIA